MKIRELEFEDFYDIKKLLSQLNNEKMNELTLQNFLVFIKTTKETKNANGERIHYIFVLEDNNSIVGCATIIIELKLLHGFSKVCHIEDVVIDNTIRGKGYGKFLINYLVDFAKNVKLVYKIILDCSDDKIGFYEKCGFLKKNNQMAIYF